MKVKEGFYPMNCLRICIDECSETILRGRVYSPLSKEALLFRDYGELLLGADALFDQAGYPQAFQAKRSFQDMEDELPSYCLNQEVVRPPEEIVNKRGRTVTYNVVVLARQHTSWQGIVYSEGGGKIGNFLGDMELLRYLTKE